MLASLLCTIQASPAPKNAEEQSDRSTVEPDRAYYRAYTQDNVTHSTLEQIMRDIAASKGENSHGISKR